MLREGIRTGEIEKQIESVRFYLDGMKDSKLDGPDGLAAATLRSLHAECARADELEADRDALRELVGGMREVNRYVIEEIPWKGNEARGSLGGARDLCLALEAKAAALLGKEGK